MLGIGTVAAFAIEGDRAGRGCKGHEQVGTAVDARQAEGAAAGDRIVATGIENHDVEPALRGRHGIDRLRRHHGAALEVSLVLDVLADRDEIVLAIHLDAMTGKIE